MKQSAPRVIHSDLSVTEETNESAPESELFSFCSIATIDSVGLGESVGVVVGVL